MNPTDPKNNPSQDNSDKSREAAANIIRGQLDNLFNPKPTNQALGPVPVDATPAATPISQPQEIQPETQQPQEQPPKDEKKSKNHYISLYIICIEFLFSSNSIFHSKHYSKQY